MATATKKQSVKKTKSDPKPEVKAKPEVETPVSKHKETQVGNEQIEPTAPKQDAPTVFGVEKDLAGDSNFKLIAFDQVFRQDNVRTTASLKLEEMVQSLTLKGFKKNHPIVVSQKADGRFLVLCGNRRTEGLEVIAARNPELFTSVLPDGMIPAIVHTGLTAEDEILIRIDHSADEDRVPLDEWGEFLAVKQLVRAGYDSQANIAAKLGKFDDKNQPKRSWVQQRVNLARLPSSTQSEMESYCMNGAGASHLRWNHVPGLYKTFLKEFKNGHREGGPEYKKLIDGIINPVVDPDAPDVPPKALSKTKMEEQAQNMTSRAVQRTLMKAAGLPTDVDEEGKPFIAEWTDIDADGVRCETAEHQLLQIATHMGQAEFNALLDEIKATVEG